ncbi:MAG: hypothetical protein PHS93_08090 [Candidatus Omnitrophica bacterium]|nr:hypothetical protein [Candidatus Omnitrophota bacterium]MDD5353102.1 hypothetical protein [Candidatus Omnitrophota bacterium]MDD5551479.1 hypothetical protein [Candidatus Omnitrophota bacterium]
MIVIYYQNKETKKTYIREFPNVYPIYALEAFRSLWNIEYYSWLGEK